MKLLPHQQRALAHILKHDRCALYLAMGMGKTLTTLVALQSLPRPALVVAPARVVDTVWRQEAQKWQIPLTVEAIKGTPAKRQEILETSRADVMLISYDLLRWLIDAGQWRWNTVVFDESDRLKDRATKTFKAVRKIAQKFQRVIQLTGTPASDTLISLWSQLYLLDRGERLGRTLTAYRDRFFVSDYMGWNWQPRPGAQERIHERISDICISMSTADGAALPDKMIIDVPVVLPPKARKVYDTLRKDMIASIDETPITAVTAGVLAGKLLQVTSGAVYDENGAAQELHTEKRDAIDSIIAQSGGQNIILVYQYRHELERLRKAYPQLVELRDSAKTVDDWNAGKIKMLAIHPASAGHGINLQHGGCLMVWVTLTYSLSKYEQTCARLHRMGQTRPVMIYRLIATDTIDERVCDVLARKTDTQQALLSALEV